MAELSAETQAIIDRLKAEGDLNRNSGTNSIKSVKVQLDRFEGVFNAISTNMAEQTNLLRMQMGLAEEKAEFEKRQRDFEDLKREEEKSTEVQNSTNDSGKENKKSTMDMMKNFFSTGLSWLKNALLVGGGLFVGANFLKGFAQGGGFDGIKEVLADTKWEDVKTGVSNFVNGLNTINWTQLGETVNNLTTNLSNFSSWVADNATQLLLGAAITRIAGSAASGAATAIFSDNGGRRGRRNPSGGTLVNRATRNKLRLSVAGIVATGLLIAGDSAKDWVTSQEWSQDEIAGISKGDIARAGIDITQYASVGALTLGQFFGPTGMLIGAIGGIAYYGLTNLKNYLDERANELSQEAIANYNNAVDAAVQTEEGDTQATLDAMLARFRALSAAEKLSGRAQEDRMREIAMRDQELRAAMERAAAAESQGEGLVGRELGKLEAEDIFNEGGTKSESLRQALSRIATADYTPEIARELGMDAFRSALEQDMQEIFRSNPDLRTNMATQNEVVNSVLNGFFGNGVGRGNVVEQRGERALYLTSQGVNGQQAQDDLLDTLIKAEQSRQIQMQQITDFLTGAGAGGVTVVAPTTVAPTVNNIEGDKSASQTTILATGSSGPNYGLPGTVND